METLLKLDLSRGVVDCVLTRGVIMRSSNISRDTLETKIKLKLNIDGYGEGTIKTGIGFFDHMLILFKKHGGFDLDLTCDGDLYVDGHHTVEDIGIVLGKAFREAMGDKKGIKRYGTSYVPMDETLAMVSLDLSGRSFLVFNVDMDKKMIGAFDSELLEEFLRAFAFNGGITLHVNLMYGSNSHHIVEGIFKALGRALREALTVDETIKGVMSTKGVLE